MSDPMEIVSSVGLVAHDIEMEKNIGRQIRFNYDPADSRFGTIHRDYTFTIVGVQKNYRGELCYRVSCDGFEDRFGSVASIGEFGFIQ